MPFAPVLAAAADFQSPLFWALFIGWILSVVLHEFAHGLVGYWGGDYTIRERGGLSLNPLQYVHPVFSLLMPAIFLLLGGVPLPGGATYVRHDLLRSRAWDSAVSLGGPAMNFLLFLIGAIALHPKTGWVPDGLPAVDWSNAQKLVGALTILEITSVMLNLIPIPPLDGFGAICPFLHPATQEKLRSPPVTTMLLVGLFMVLRSEHVFQKFYGGADFMLGLLGYDDSRIDQVGRAFNFTLFGASW